MLSSKAVSEGFAYLGFGEVGGTTFAGAAVDKRRHSEEERTRFAAACGYCVRTLSKP